MPDLYQTYNNMVNMKPSNEIRRDDQYTYYPYVHTEGEPAYEDPATGIMYYKVPNSKVGIEGMANQAMSMGRNIYDSMRNEAMGYYDWFQDPNKFAAQHQGLERMAEGAKNMMGATRGYAEQLMNDGPYSDVPEGKRRR